jgi:hypothetical protein
MEGTGEVEAVVAHFKATSRHFHSWAVSKPEKSQSGKQVSQATVAPEEISAIVASYSIFSQQCNNYAFTMYFQMVTCPHAPLMIVSLPLATMYNIRC